MRRRIVEIQRPDTSIRSIVPIAAAFEGIFNLIPSAPMIIS